MNLINQLGVRLAAAVFLAVLPATGLSAADAADLSRYSGSSANLSAVATAVSLVEPCDGEITYREEVVESYQVIELLVACSKGDEISAGVMLRFDMLEGGKIKPASFGAAQ